MCMIVMSRKVLCIVMCAVVFLSFCNTNTAVTLSKEDVIYENFDWSRDSAGRAICPADSFEGKREIIRYSLSTGFGWGGFNACTLDNPTSTGILAAPGGNLVFQQNTTTHTANRVGSYVYTIFSDKGANVPTHYVDLTHPGATFKIYVIGDASDQAIRWLIRDVNRDWYISVEHTQSPRIPEARLPELGMAYPVLSYTWLHIDPENEKDMNELDNGRETSLKIRDKATPDLSKITGGGFYIARSNGDKEFRIKWIKFNRFEPVVPFHPGYSSHYIKTRNDVVWGFSQWGGASCGEFRIGDSENLNAAGWGRAFQSAFRDAWHQGKYNPTQGGRTEVAGPPVVMKYGVSSTGKGTRIDYEPFQVATMGRWDNTQYNDLTPKFSAPGDEDTLEEAGYSEKDEIMTEFYCSGFYEDVSHIVKNEKVSAIRMYQQYDYTDPPHMILQYKAALNENGYVEDISSVLEGQQPSTPIDLANILFFWGYRIDRNTVNYNWFWWPDGKGGWSVGSLEKRARPGGEGWVRPPDNTTYLTMLVESENDPDANAIGLYYPPWSRVNRCNVAGVETKTGKIVYEEDRKQSLTWRAGWRTAGKGPNAWKTFEDNGIAGPRTTNNFNKTDFGTPTAGLLAPGNGLPGVHERIRFEAFHLVGTPNSIREAVADIDDYFKKYR